MLDLIPFSATGASASPETPSACWIQLSYRDAALREDPEFSGMPPEFEQWCRTSWLPANLGRDYYRKQAEAHVASLAQRIANVQRAIEEKAGGLLDERDRMIQQRLWLQNELDNAGAG